MRKRGKKLLFAGSIFIVAFIIWTLLIQKIDVRPLGANGTNIGFATINCWFHKLTGVHMTLYTITDWLGLIPIFICILNLNKNQVVEANSPLIFLKTCNRIEPGGRK